MENFDFNAIIEKLTDFINSIINGIKDLVAKIREYNDKNT